MSSEKEDLVKSDSSEGRGVPVRLYVRKISGGRVKVSASIPVGGSWLGYENILREVLDGKRSEVYFSFVPDTAEYRAQRKGK